VPAARTIPGIQDAEEVDPSRRTKPPPDRSYEPFGARYHDHSPGISYGGIARDQQNVDVHRVYSTIPNTVNENEKLLSVMLTFQCTAECSHCGTVSSPRDHTWLALEQAISAIDQAAELGYTGVVFTGGEPTLALEKLVLAMSHARSRRLPVRLVTNAHWAVDDDAAESLVFEWMCAGLSELNVSTGDRHAKFVPLERALRAVRAAARLYLRAALLVETSGSDWIDPATLKQRLPDGVRVVPWVWSPLVSIQKSNPPGAVNRSNLDRHSGCDGLFSNFTIQANGVISPCCGLGIRFVPELQVGQIGVGKLAEAEDQCRNNALLQRIRNEGPERLLAWAAEQDLRIKWEDMFAHRCEACIRLHKDRLVREVLDGQALSESPARSIQITAAR
jgi:organic radical activating enzyme